MSELSEYIERRDAGESAGRLRPRLSKSVSGNPGRLSQNAIEIRGLSKSFGKKQALSGLNMNVPAGAIYGFIGENGSGKSTTEKIICGLQIPDSGRVTLFGRPYTEQGVRSGIGVLIETPGCFPDVSVWNNLRFQAANLGIKAPETEIARVLKLVRMEGAASNKYKFCSLGMKQRIGIAMALLGHPSLLILDEPINGLDADGMRIMREILKDITKNHHCTVLISSHILSELEKIATHYGIIRKGKMLREMTAEELERDCRTYTALKAEDMALTRRLLEARYSRVEEKDGFLRVYDLSAGKDREPAPHQRLLHNLSEREAGGPAPYRRLPYQLSEGEASGSAPRQRLPFNNEIPAEEIVSYLYKNGVPVQEVHTDKVSLEEYYMDLMKEGR